MERQRLLLFSELALLSASREELEPSDGVNEKHRL